jgi:superfamily II DNA or RNA helicase
VTVGEAWGGRTPRAWQATALPVVLGALQARRRGVVTATMGSGKSVLQSEVVAQHLLTLAADEVTVITAPKQSLVRQLGDTFAERLGHDVVGRYFADVKQADRSVIVSCNASAAALARELGVRGRKVGLWVADEVHSTESGGIIDAARALAPAAACGFTATPFRSKKTETLQLWDEVVVTYTPADALRDGVIVPYTLATFDGDEGTGVNAATLDLIERHAHGPGLVNAASISDAEWFAGQLVARGISAAAIHSKQTDAVRRELEVRLRGGDLRCLVHVSLLTEGVDWPWLRWLALRRKVKARVRFVQEVGRVLRALDPVRHAEDIERFGPKSTALLLDPRDLFSRFALTYEEALGFPPPRVPVVIEDDEDDDDDFEPEAGPEDRAVRVQAVAAWSRALLLAVRAEGLALTDFPLRTGRDTPASANQRGTLGQMVRRLARYAPEQHEALIARAPSSGAIRKGEASDLISMLQGLAWMAQNKPRGWRWRPLIDVPLIAPATLDVPIEEPPQPTRMSVSTPPDERGPGLFDLPDAELEARYGWRR